MIDGRWTNLNESTIDHSSRNGRIPKNSDSLEDERWTMGESQRIDHRSSTIDHRPFRPEREMAIRSK